MPVKRPQGNSLVLAVPRSPVHFLLSGAAIELRYAGRRSGRHYVLPVQYARDEERLVVLPQHAESKTWWRNFLTPQPVRVRLRGRLHAGIARVVRPGDPGGKRIGSCISRGGGGWRVVSLDPSWRSLFASSNDGRRKEASIWAGQRSGLPHCLPDPMDRYGAVQGS